MTDDDEIKSGFIYVKFNNEFYTTLEEVYSKVRKEIIKFQSKNK